MTDALNSCRRSYSKCYGVLSPEAAIAHATTAVQASAAFSADEGIMGSKPDYTLESGIDPQQSTGIWAANFKVPSLSRVASYRWYIRENGNNSARLVPLQLTFNEDILCRHVSIEIWDPGTSGSPGIPVPIGDGSNFKVTLEVTLA